MHYAISDIHGCFDKFKRMLEEIEFSSEDTLYIVGDCFDRGTQNFELLEFISSYDNIIPIIGNHEYMLINILPALLQEVEDDNIEKVLTKELYRGYLLWLQDGAKPTIEMFRNMSKEDREFYFDYISDFSLYEKVIVNNRKFCLVHSLPDNLDIENTPIEKIVFNRRDFNKPIEGDVTYIIGHTPTALVDMNYAGKIYKTKNLFDIDCGTVFNQNLGCLRLEDLKEFYVK